MLLGHDSTLLSWQPHQSGWTPDLSLKLQPLSDFGYAKKKKVSSADQALLHVFMFKILRLPVAPHSTRFSLECHISTHLLSNSYVQKRTVEDLSVIPGIDKWK